MSLYDLEVDVDDLRCQLLVETNEALALAVELADAVEQDRLADARLSAARFRETRSRIRQLRMLIRCEEGQR